MPKRSKWKYGDRSAVGIDGEVLNLTELRHRLNQTDENDPQRVLLLDEATALASVLEARASGLRGSAKRARRARIFTTTEDRAEFEEVFSRGHTDTAAEDVNKLPFWAKHTSKSTPQQIQGYLEEETRKKMHGQEMTLTQFEYAFLDTISRRLPVVFMPIDYIRSMITVLRDSDTGIDSRSGEPLPGEIVKQDNETLIMFNAQTPKLLKMVIGQDFSEEISEFYNY